MGPPADFALRLGIPRVTAHAAALFRIALGSLFVLLLLTRPGLAGVDPGAVVQPGSGYGIGTWALMHWVKASPGIHRVVYLAATVGAVGVVVGLWTRVCTAILWCSLFVLIGVSLVTSGQHNWGVPLIALIGIVLAPLADAWSLDALRRRRTIERSPRAYGLVLWWVGLVLGSAFLAAAYAKLSRSGLAWITTGAVRFHFMEDAAQAPFSLGYWVAGHEWAAVLMSAAAIVIEGSFILVTLCRSDRWRGLAGIVGLSLHLGFYVFQGVLWLPWIVLYVAFLPWEAISRWLARGRAVGRTDVTERSLWHLSPAFGVAVAYVLTAQVYASAQRVEYEPLLSNMPMYSSTYRSWDAFVANLRWSKFQTYAFRLSGAGGDDTVLAGIVNREGDALVDAVHALCTGQNAPSRSVLRLASLHQRVSAHLGRDADKVDVFIEDLREIDFSARRLNTRRVNRHIATVRLSTATLDDESPAVEECRTTAPG